MGRRYYSGDADVYKMKVWMARCTTWYAGTRVTWRVGDALICWHGQNQKPRGLHTPFRIQYDLPDLDPTTWLTRLFYKGSPFKPTSPARPSFWYLHHTCMLHSKYFHTHCLYFFPKSVFFHTPNYPFNTWLVFHFPRSENVFFISLGRILILLVMSVILMEKKIIYNIFLINRSFSHVLIFELYY